MRERPVGEVDVNASAHDSFWFETYQAHGTAILAFLTSRVGRRDVAEDLLQETFVRAMRRLGPSSEGGNIKSYLFTTAHRLIIDRRRRQRPALFSEVETDAARPLDESRPAELAVAADDAVDLRTIRELVDEELALLSPDQRTAFEAAVLEQQSYPEVARERGWTVAKVKIDVYRARKRLMERLRDRLQPDLETVS